MKGTWVSVTSNQHEHVLHSGLRGVKKITSGAFSESCLNSSVYTHCGSRVLCEEMWARDDGSEHFCIEEPNYVGRTLSNSVVARQDHKECLDAR